MNNREKFEQVFGVKFTEEVHSFCAIAPDEVCHGRECVDCPYNTWWQQEYNGADKRTDTK